MKPTVIVGIAGGTCSGKTSVAKKVADLVGRDEVVILSQDSYYRDLKDLTPEERARWNFDRPEAFDNELILSHLENLLAGREIAMPVYSFKDHARTGETILIPHRHLVIIEGILVLQNESIRKKLDFHVYVEEEADIRLARRLQRDEVERGRSAQSVLLQYLETVRPMHLQFVEPSKRYADIIIPRGGENRAAIEILANHIKALIEL